MGELNNQSWNVLQYSILHYFTVCFVPSHQYDTNFHGDLGLSLNWAITRLINWYYKIDTNNNTN